MKRLSVVLGLVSLLLLMGALTFTGATSFPVSAATVQSHTAQAWSSCPPTISRGSSGSAVILLQRDLRLHVTPTLPVDGIFSFQTEKAVIDWQKTVGLTPNGIVGPETWASLGECD